MTHANAPLTPAGRLRLARCVVDDGWPLRRAAERFQVAVSTAKRWADRYRDQGEAGMTDRSSRPHHSPACGELLHVDIKKLGNIPDGGGHRAVGRQTGQRHRTRTPGKTLDSHGRSHVGYSYLHNAVDDHSRLAYSEILPDERKETAVAFWQRAHAFFAAHGITVQRVLTDNGSCYKSRLWRDSLTTAGIAHKRTCPYRPQTNGKVERFNRTLLDEWAYARPYRSETERREALPRWLHTYNHHRGHTALTGHPPASRVLGLPGQCT